MIPNLCVGTFDQNILIPDRNPEITGFQAPFSILSHESQVRGRDAHLHLLALARFQGNLLEGTQAAVVRHHAGHQVAGIQQHRLLAGPVAGILDGHLEHQFVSGRKDGSCFGTLQRTGGLAFYSGKSLVYTAGGI